MKIQVIKKKINAKENKTKTIEVKQETKQKQKIVLVKRKSIAQIVFGFIKEKDLINSQNRKEHYLELEALIKKEFPNSAFKKTHYYWYLTRYVKQLNANLNVDCLHTIKEK